MQAAQNSLMNCRIVPTTDQHVPGFWQVFDTVAREGRFLARTEAPPLEDVREYLLSNVKAGAPNFVVLSGDSVAGWCDVALSHKQTQRHIGTLGMGLLPEVRGRGLGSQLLDRAIKAAWTAGLSRIELTVRDDNLVARRLYEKFGFDVEGVLRKASIVGDQVNDVVMMALLSERPGPQRFEE